MTSRSGPSGKRFRPGKTSIPRPHPQPPPLPEDRAAVYLAVYEGVDESHLWFDLSTTTTATRNCSILVQRDPRIDKFTEYFYGLDSGAGNQQQQLSVVPNLPNPKANSPGLLAMHFVAWIPHARTRDLDEMIRHLEPSWIVVAMPLLRNIWIEALLLRMAGASLITMSQQRRALAEVQQALQSSRRGPFPNEHVCFRPTAPANAALSSAPK